MRLRSYGLAIALLAILNPVRVRAHDAPIPPSTCAFNPVMVSVPGLGLVGTGVPAAPESLVRIVYIPRRQVAQFVTEGAASRDITGLGTTGTLSWPATFEARLFGGGDFVAEDVPLTLTMNGVPASVSVTLTTGLSAAGETVVPGAPMSDGGQFTFAGAGIATGSGSAADGQAAVVQLTCSAAPVPDLDQFPPVATGKLSGRISERALRLQSSINTGGAMTDFTLPLNLQVSLDGAPLLTFALPGGLTAGRRHTLVGSSVDGTQTVTLKQRSRRAGVLYGVSIRAAGHGGAAPSGSRLATLTLEVGGLVARGSRTFRVSRNGTMRPAR